MNLTIDFETKSRVDLTRCGAYRYAEDESTQVNYLGVKVEGEPARLWLPPLVQCPISMDPAPMLLNDKELAELIERATTISAHNMAFERVIWRNKMVPLSFPDLPLSKLRCTMAQAGAMGLPRALAPAGAAMGLQTQKDANGYKVMMKLCKPDKDGNFVSDPELFAQLYRYCLQDCRADEMLGAALPPLTDAEQKIWELDQIINDRGLPVDKESTETIIAKLEVYEAILLKEVVSLSDGKLKSVRQRDRMLEWLDEKGAELEGLKKKDVADALQTDLPPTARRLLEIRQVLARSSVSKLDALLAWRCKDGRLRGCFNYCGANTGRWTAHGFQPHNLPRDSFGGMTEEVIRSYCEDPLEINRLTYGDPFQTASKLIRPMIQGNLLWADFAAIEARVNAWGAKQRWKVDAFAAFDREEGPDLYRLAYSKAFGTPIEEIDKHQRQIGKVMELALGYQGGKNAFTKMGAGYGLYVDEETAQTLVDRWRNVNGGIVHWWYDLEDTAIQTMRSGNPHNSGPVRWSTKGGWLFCRLPSGRSLAYPFAMVESKKTPWGEDKAAVTYMTTEQRHWTRVQTFGGLFCENVVQAIARDLLAWGMIRVEKAGYRIIGHVHDEIIAEGKGKPEELAAVMAKAPHWAKDCPIAAEGTSGGRYCK